MSVKENGSLLGVQVRGSCHSTLGDGPLLASWNGASPPPPVVPAASHSGVLPMPFSVPWGRGTPNSSLSADTSRLLSLEGRGGWCRQLGS